MAEQRIMVVFTVRDGNTRVISDREMTKSISIRLQVDMIDALKVKANSMDVPCQSLIKMILNEGLRA